MKRIVPAGILCALLGAATAAQEPATITVESLPCSLAGEWLFRTGHDPAWASPFRERRYWQKINVPGSWEAQGFASYNGHAWYRVTFFLPSRFAGERLGLDLGTIGDADEVFLNGRAVGGMGSAPPSFQKATLLRRFYLIPRDATRFGEYNELAIHVYNDTRFGGMLGPAPRLDIWNRVMFAQVGRDIAAWVITAFLGTLALLQLVLFATQRESHEHLAFASFLLAIAVYVITYTSWGPAAAFGQNINFRVNVACLLAAVALFPPALFTLARRKLPVPVLAAQSLLALGAAFTVVWREVSDLYFWVYLAEIAAAVFAVITLRIIAVSLWQAAWGRALFFAAVGFLLPVGVDVLVDIGFVPRMRVGFGELYSPIGLVPFSLVLSFALVARWAERRWGEPLDLATGLLPMDRFKATMDREMDRSRRSSTPLTVALLRVNGSDTLGAADVSGSQAARVLRRSLRQVDLLARHPNGTFAILLADTEERAAMATLERLRRAIADTAAPGRPRPSTAAGLAQYRPARHSVASELLAEAEGALYAALNEGGDCTATAP